MDFGSAPPQQAPSYGAAPASPASPMSQLKAWQRKMKNTCQRYLDASVPHRSLRWCIFAFLMLLYVARVVSFGGFYIITYALCIHLLYLVLMLVTPLSDPETSGGDSTSLPTNAETKSEDPEFRPFQPQVQEFVVWRSMTKVLAICLFLTMFSFLDIPVYWPILLIYFILLCCTQMGGRIRHMIRYGYVPWNAGKPKYVPKNNV